MKLAEDMLNGVSEAAAYCGIPARSLYHMAEKGAVPCKRVGRRIFFRKSELDAFFRSDAA